MRIAKEQVRRATQCMAISEPPLDPPDEEGPRWWPTHEVMADLAKGNNKLFVDMLKEQFMDELEVRQMAQEVCKAGLPDASQHLRDYYQDRLFRLMYETGLKVAEKMRQSGDWVDPDEPVDFEPDYDMEARCYG
jgi:hypothetical protein